MTAAMRKKSIQQQAEAAPQLPNAPLTPEERERYNVDDRVYKMMKKHNLSREDAEEVVREVMEGAAGHGIPLKVHCESGESWGAFH